MGAEMRGRLRLEWLRSELGDGAQERPLAGDASFRRYYRVSHADRDYVLMDAPPPHENVRLFMQVRDWFDKAGLRVSKLHAADAELGFLLLEDFGDLTWAAHLVAGGKTDALFADALDQLRRLQDSQPDLELPVFDLPRMQRECDLYLDWYLPQVAGIAVDELQRSDFHTALRGILKQIETLPRVPVHLDYHSRNLMLPAGALPLGQIDYQDAVMGPVTYDLASLLYDCYQDYPEAVRRCWSRYFYQALPAAVGDAFEDFEDWHHKVRLTALQRHIKAIGIFARLAYRDGKRQFLDEIPLTRKHLLEELLFLAWGEHDCPLLFSGPAAAGKA